MGANDWTVKPEQVAELRRSKTEGWSIELIDHFPPLHTLTSLTFLGSWAWTSPHEKRKLILKDVAIEYGGGWATPADLARDYLAIKYPKFRGKVNTRQYHSTVKDKKHQPQYVRPSWGEGAYLDMKAAYWQILQVGGWDVDYSRYRFLGIKSAVWDFPFPDYKLARNCLVSMGLPSRSILYEPEKGIYTQHKKGSTINLVLWAFVQDVLHGIAADMIEVGAVYANTDGYIVPTNSIDDAFNVAANWGVHLVSKFEGWYTVRGIGDYDFSASKSRYRRKAKAYTYIKNLEGDWLRKLFKAWSYRIIV